MVTTRHHGLGVHLLLVSLAIAPAVTAGDGPPPGPADRCPVCGMFVAKYQNWIATVRFDDGSRVYFDGPKDMFRYVLDLGAYRPGSTVGDIEKIAVTDYYTTEVIDARGAFFVVGTDVMGPMGRELVPTRSRDEAVSLMKDHGGEKILAFEEVKLRELP